MDFWDDPNSAWTRDWNRAGSGDWGEHPFGWQPDGSYKNPDGTVQTLDEVNAMREKKGLPPVVRPGSAEAKANQAQNTVQGETYGYKDFGEFLGKVTGFSHSEVAPGSSALDTSRADQERARLGPLLAQLQQQAATGDGAWQQALAQSTGQALHSAEALGQSQPGVGYASQLHNIGNAQSAIGQRAVGQGNTLRAQSQLAGQTQLEQLLSGMGGQDASQAIDSAGALQGEREANNQARGNAAMQMGNTVKAGAQAASTIASMSDGGPVPGQPQVFGDDDRNDTVPALLSPGEIVIPRSHSGSPEQAADFVRALQASRGQVRHLAVGGDTTINTVGSDLFGSSPEAASVKNGALLDTSAYDASRSANLANSELLGKSAAGAGPSVAPQAMQSSSDANIAAALQAMNGSRGLPAGDVLQATGAAQQHDAGGAAATVAGEQQHGQAGFIHALLAQRARDQALALAQQQAKFRNTQMNMGLDAAQQASIRNVTGAGSQAFATLATAGGGKGGTNDFSGSDKNLPSFDQGFGPGGDAGGSSPDEWNNPYAHGGEVHAKSAAPPRPVTAAPRRVDPNVPHVRKEIQRVWPTENGIEDRTAEPAVVYQDVFAHGGEVPDADEEERARAFLAELRRSRRAA